MEETVRLRDIFIGKADGLTEAKRKDFTNLFYNGNNAYTQLVEDDAKFMISGRKGTGKTILAKYYEQEVKNDGGITRFVNGNDVLLSHIKEIGNDDLEDKKVASFIKYTVLYEISVLIIENKIDILKSADLWNIVKYIKTLSKLQKIVNNRRKNGNFSISDFSKEYESNIMSTISKGGFVFGSNDKVGKKENYKKNSYYALIDNLEEMVLLLAKKKQIALIFDDIDEYIEKAYDNDVFYLFLNKFVEIVHEVNEDFCLKTKKKSKVILLMRSDIIDQMQTKSSNINKIVTDSQILLNWIRYIKNEAPEENMLMDLILTKIKNSNTNLKEKTNHEIYSMFFPEKVGNTKFISYIFNESHGRPRDIINLLNIIRKSNPKETKFTEEMFIKAEKEYSRCFKDEVKNEMVLFYPSEMITSCFRVVTLIGKTKFRVEDIENVIEKCAGQVHPVNSSKEFVDIMYDAGVIGNFWKKGNLKKYSFKYREDGNEFPDYRTYFTVHMGLRKALLKL